MPDFLFLADHPFLDFLNTRPVLHGRRVELLAGFEDLLGWLTRAGLLDPRRAREARRRWDRTPEGRRTGERARAFRETLREAVEGISRGRTLSARGVAAVNAVLGENAGSLRLERFGAGYRTRFAARSDRPVFLLGLVAETAADLIANADWGRIRRCGNPSCVLFLYDTTRNRARQWCSMATCGNLMKVRAFRRRHRRKERRSPRT